MIRKSKTLLYISEIFSAILFIACCVFVIQRGIMCFKKFLDDPESSSITYDFSKNYPFPSISFCAIINGKNGPKCRAAYDDAKLKKCGLSFHGVILDDFYAHFFQIYKSMAMVRDVQIC